jgi:hypothetical protein
MNSTAIVAGAFVGLMVGLTGVGGGSLMTPILLLIFGSTPLAAVGTDLWFAALTKITAVPIYHIRRQVDWPVLRRLWLGSLTASALTTLWLRAHAGDRREATVLTVAIALSLLLAAAAMLWRERHTVPAGERPAAMAKLTLLETSITIAMGAFLGLVVTLTSVGAGALGAVLLTFAFPRRLSVDRIVGTDVVHAVPLALFAGCGHLLIGDVQTGLLLTLLAGSIPGVLAGAALSSRVPSQVLRRLLVALLIAVGLKMLWGAFR